MSLYRILMDSIKLFFINVFIFIIFIEGYVLLILAQSKLNSELPFIGLFYAGMTTFLGIIFWMNISHVWLGKVKSHAAMIVRVIYSEIPFIMLMFILWGMNEASNLQVVEKSYIASLLWFIILYPLVMYTARFHTHVFDEYRKQNK